MLERFAVPFDLFQEYGRNREGNAWRIEAAACQHVMDQPAMYAPIAIFKGVYEGKAEGYGSRRRHGIDAAGFALVCIGDKPTYEAREILGSCADDSAASGCSSGPSGAACGFHQWRASRQGGNAQTIGSDNCRVADRLHLRWQRDVGDRIRVSEEI